MKNVLITGSTLGIGYEIAKLYAKDNNNLILVARNKERLESVKAELLSSYNINVHIISADLAKEDSIDKVLNYIDKENLDIDVLINNAGIGSFGYFNETDIQKELTLIDLNIKSLVKLTRVFLEKMTLKNSGEILNVASVAGFCAGPKMANYYASKAYVLSFTEAIREEFKGRGIRVSCLCPGPVDTPFIKSSGMQKNGLVKDTMMSANDVAKIAYTEFKKGKAIIIPGLKNKLLITMNKFAPRSLVRKIILNMNS